MTTITITIHDNVDGTITVQQNGLGDEVMDRYAQKKDTPAERFGIALLNIANDLIAEGQQPGAVAPPIIITRR